MKLKQWEKNELGILIPTMLKLHWLEREHLREIGGDGTIVGGLRKLLEKDFCYDLMRQDMPEMKDKK